MSAFLVDPEHINVLIHAGMDRQYGAKYGAMSWYFGNPLDRQQLLCENADAVGQMLLDANAASVNCRYAEENSYVYSYIRPQAIDWAPVELLKAIACYEYQSCEVRDWQGSAAWAFCQSLTKSIIRALPGWDGADTWEITIHSRPLSSIRGSSR